MKLCAELAANIFNLLQKIVANGSSASVHSAASTLPKRGAVVRIEEDSHDLQETRQRRGSRNRRYRLDGGSGAWWWLRRDARWRLWRNARWRLWWRLRRNARRRLRRTRRRLRRIP